MASVRLFLHLPIKSLFSAQQVLLRCAPPIQRQTVKVFCQHTGNSYRKIYGARSGRSPLICPGVPRVVTTRTSQQGSSQGICSSSWHQNQFHHQNANTTLDPEELEKFKVLSQKFWKENGDFQALHRLNDLRVPLIRDILVKQRVEGHHSATKPLHGAVIVDVGCGGGILAEPLSRLGATVIGVDATQENIEVAQHHLSHDPTIRGNVKYICGTAEDLLVTESEQFDAVVASEVIEHVTNKEAFIQTCVRLVKVGVSSSRQ